MEWSSLIVLICPIMMVLMMLLGGHKHGKHSHMQQGIQSSKEMEEKLNKLEQDNEEMRKKLDSMYTTAKKN